MYTRGELAKRAKINSETIRFYERKKLFPEPERTPAGYRIYSNDDLSRLNFISLAKDHGFSLFEIKELLDLRISKKTSCETVRSISEEKIKKVDEKILELKRIKRALQQLVNACHKGGPSGDCPILDAFESQE
jgi:MerR family mercuric resistance operon transcriptional regulator